MAAWQPDSESVDSSPPLNALVVILSGRRLVALTGAGCSTESGIPDYRGNGRPPVHAPIQHDAFVRRPDVRQRYWARATVGWARFSRARPNPAHDALAAMERAGLLRGIITQNVDRLHNAAGSRRVVELHGALAEVRCLSCGDREDRSTLQGRLLAANPGWLDRAGSLAPDGDAELSPSEIAGFHVPGCRACDGPLMPDVVFFGGHVSAAKVAAAWALLEEAEALLVVGSSLAVYSGWRFVRGAAERGVPIAIVNIGRTRADEISEVRIAAAAGALLPRLAARLQEESPKIPPRLPQNPAQ
jgi:NAD-dependent deacetylase sirtuin 4